MRTLGDCSQCPLQPINGQASSIYMPPVEDCIGLIVIPAPLHTPLANLLVQALRTIEVDPKNVAVISLTACARHNKRARPDAEIVTACRPKFEEELKYFLETTPVSLPVVCLGQEAAEAVGLKDQLSKTRGFSYWQNKRRYIPSWHPFFVTIRPENYLDLLEDLTNAFLYPVECPVWHDVVTDAPVEYPWTGKIKAEARRIEREKRRPTDLEVAFLTTFVPDVIPTPLSPVVDFEIIDDARGMDKLLSYVASANKDQLFCLDIETSGFDQFREEILCIGIGVDYNKAYIISSQGVNDPGVGHRLRQLFGQPKVKWVLHNAKFDCRFLLTHLNIEASPHVDEDTMLMHYVLDERIGTHGLKMLARRRLGLPEYESAIHALLPKAASTYKLVPPPVLHLYAAQDVCYTLRLYDRLQTELECHPLSEGLTNVYRFLIRAENAFIDIENAGIYMDLDAIDAAEEDFRTELAFLLSELRARVGNDKFNPGSAKQVAAFLYDVRGYPEVRLFKNHKPRATSREALDKLLAKFPSDTFLTTLIKYRELSKILSTYVVKMRSQTYGGRLHTDFKLHGTVTGRLSAAKPNVQNIPRTTKNKYAAQIRNFFTATPGWIMVGADYKSAELRVATLYSHEKFWKDAFERGVDVHSEMCKALFGPNFTKEHRMIAKMMVFGLLYGRGAASIAVERGWSTAQAKDTMRKFFKNVPNADRWLKQTRELAISQGYLTTPMGRMRRFGLVNEVNLGSVSSQAVNFPISSFASDCCLNAFLDMHDWFKASGKGRCLMVIHDAIYVECPVQHEEEVSAKLGEIMRASMQKLIDDEFVTLEVDLHSGMRWGEV